MHDEKKDLIDSEKADCYADRPSTLDAALKIIMEQQAELSQMAKERDDLLSENKELTRQNLELERLISDEPRCKTLLPPEAQRLWEACITLVEKAQYKVFIRYVEKIEQMLQERSQGNENLRKAIKPFADYVAEVDRLVSVKGEQWLVRDDKVIIPLIDGAITHGDFRRLAELYVKQNLDAKKP